MNQLQLFKIFVNKIIPYNSQKDYLQQTLEREYLMKFKIRKEVQRALKTVKKNKKEEKLNKILKITQ